MLMSIFDTDHSASASQALKARLTSGDAAGTISFDEFRGVFQYVQDWRRIFANFDADRSVDRAHSMTKGCALNLPRRSGTIQHGELTQALGQFGYHLSPRLVHLLILKYSASTVIAAKPRA